MPETPAGTAKPKLTMADVDRIMAGDDTYAQKTKQIEDGFDDPDDIFQKWSMDQGG